jgi:hypothetical protein
MTQAQLKMRDLMPEGYGPILKDRTGKTLPHIYTVVNQERTRAAIWPQVLKLAEEHQQQIQLNRKKLIKLKTQTA